jgi:hypothetical protein
MFIFSELAMSGKFDGSSSMIETWKDTFSLGKR